MEAAPLLKRKPLPPASKKSIDSATAATPMLVIINDEASTRDQIRCNPLKADQHRIIPIAIEVSQGYWLVKPQRLFIIALDEVNMFRREVVTVATEIASYNPN